MKKLIILFLFIALAFPIFSLAQIHDGKDSLHKSVLEKKIDCSFENRSVEEILNTINTQYGINFNYINEEIPLEKRVTIIVKDESLDEVLRTIFSGTYVHYFPVNNQIILKFAGFTEAAKDTMPPVISGGYERGRSIAMSGLSKDSLPEQVKYDAPSISDTNTVIGKVSDAAEPAGNVGKFGIGIFFSPASSYRSLKGSPGEYVERRNSDERHAINMSFGLYADFRISRDFFFRTGVYHLKFGEQGTATFPLEPQPMGAPLPVTGPPPSGSHSNPFRGNNYHDTAIAFRNTYSYLSIPLTIGYRTGGKVYFSFVSGVLLAVYLNSNTVVPPYVNNENGYVSYQTHSTDEVIIPVHYYRKLNAVYAFNVESGIRFNHVAVYLAPSFNYFLTSAYSSKDPLKEKLYSLGLSAGISFDFPKARR